MSLAFRRAPLAALLLPFLAACTSNPFLAGYSGERLAPVAAASVVAEAPAEGTARQIGTSVFQSSSGHGAADAEATAAACAVGADLVRWSVKQLNREEWIESDPVYERRASGRGQFGSYYPVPGSRERWRYSATFWRSVTSPGPSPGPAPSAR